MGRTGVEKRAIGPHGIVQESLNVFREQELMSENYFEKLGKKELA